MTTLAFSGAVLATVLTPSSGEFGACKFRKENRIVVQARTIAVVLVVLLVFASPCSAQSIYAGRLCVFGIEPNGTAWGWGRNDNGQTGMGSVTGSQSFAARLQVASPVVACAGGTDHCIILLSNGSMMACGSNARGQLGIGNMVSSVVPVPIPNMSGVIAVSAGDETSYALKSDGTVWAWGRGDYGQIGDSGNVNRLSPTQVGATNLSAVIAIDAGDHHCLALGANGAVWSWGWNSNGQIGVGTTSNASSPTQIPSLGTGSVIGVSAGEQSSAALLSDGSVWCWGDGGAGQLGNGSFSDSHVPIPSNASANVIEIAAGARHVVARKYDHSLIAWGSNQFGNLGNGTSSPSNVPIPVSFPTSVAAIAAGAGFSVALRSDGTVWVWGYGAEGQIGNGATASFNGIPSSPMVPYLGGPYLGVAGESMVQSMNGTIHDVLTINGSTGVVVSNGFKTHRVDVATTAPIVISVSQPPSNTVLPAQFVLFGIIGVPKLEDAVVLPFGLGLMAFVPHALNPLFPGTFTLANSYGGPAAVGSSAAPWSILIPSGIPIPFQIAFQGVIEQFPSGLRSTNGVILNVQ